MNDYARRMIRDGRNPYGSRGGYVTSRDPRRRDRRDRGEYDDMDMRYERDGHYHRGYDEPYKLSGNFEYEKYYDDYDCDYGYDDMRDYRGRGRRKDYGDDWDEEDMRGRARNSRGQYTSRRSRRDYGEDDDKLTKREIKDWEEDLVSDDGSHGKHFDKEMVDQKAMQMGVNPNEFQEGLLSLMTNVQYSDYSWVAKKYSVDRLDFYIDMAKAFLKDKDFDGDGAEKAYIYYKTIVEK